MITSWTCHICGEERPDEKISVYITDLSKSKNLPIGTFKQNVRYCNDKEDCIEKVKTFSFFKND